MKSIWFRAIGRKLQKSMQTRGVFGTLAFTPVYLGRKASGLAGKRRLSESAFDRDFGVDTAGSIPLSELDVTSDNWHFGGMYQPVGETVDFDQLLAQLAIPYEQFCFVDLGCGKGRAVLLASSLPFKMTVGVEFSPMLASIATENVRRWPAQRRKCGSVQILCADAAEYEFPDEPFVLFMYNPFGRPVMDRVVNNVRDAYGKRKRRIVVLYFTPKLGMLWDGIEFLSKVASGPGYSIYDGG
jgi:hypothetical protein